MGRKKLSCNGFWLFSHFWKRKLEKLGAEFPGGFPDVLEVSSKEWKELPGPERSVWKQRAKAFRKTDEFKKLQRKYQKIHALSPSRPSRSRNSGADRRRSESLESDYGIEYVGGNEESDEEEEKEERKENVLDIQDKGKKITPEKDKEKDNMGKILDSAEIKLSLQKFFQKLDASLLKQIVNFNEKEVNISNETRNDPKDMHDTVKDEKNTTKQQQDQLSGDQNIKLELKASGQRENKTEPNPENENDIKPHLVEVKSISGPVAAPILSPKVFSYADAVKKLK